MELEWFSHLILCNCLKAYIWYIFNLEAARTSHLWSASQKKTLLAV
uniref:Uncharacterized protein n=1 Tax=Rhizophora mucronata TaxID=61149 RepID=A0A2P2NZ03_RHIMU